jgi:hypothetical protein
VNAGHLYWSNGCGTSIGGADLDGTGVNPTFINGIPQAAGVAVNATWIYWAEFANPTAA